MRRVVAFLVLVGLVGCAPGLRREAVARVRLADGLEATWPRAGKPRGRRQEGESLPELEVRLRAAGEKPVVICRVVRVDDERAAGRDRAFVQDPASGVFRYDPAGDCILAHSGGVAPFSLAPAFRWYDLVLYPAGEEVTLKLDRPARGPLDLAGRPAEGDGATRSVRLVLEYVPVSYHRLARAGYVAQEGSPPGGESDEGGREDVGVVRYGRVTEDELRRRQPHRLFLRSEFLPPRARATLEIGLD